jgi:hypothetical protein
MKYELVPCPVSGCDRNHGVRRIPSPPRPAAGFGRPAAGTPSPAVAQRSPVVAARAGRKSVSGFAHAGDLTPDARRRFESSIDSTDGCWTWTAYTDKDGYGIFRIGEARIRAHRMAYELGVGPIPSGLQVCHHCDNPPCVRPDHLFVGTQGDNNRDMAAKGRHRSPTVYTHRTLTAKLTPADIQAIRDGYVGRRGEQVVIARQYGVHPSVISRLVRAT